MHDDISMDIKQDTSIDMNDYILLEYNYSHLLCILYHLFSFVVNCYLIYKYNSIKYYLISTLTIYYIIVYNDIR